MREPPLQVTAFLSGKDKEVPISRPIPSLEEAGTVSASLFRELTDAGHTVSRMVVGNLDVEQLLAEELSREIAREFIQEDHGTIDEETYERAIAAAKGNPADAAVIYTLLKGPGVKHLDTAEV